MEEEEDIHGAWGTIHGESSPQHATLWQRLLTLLVIMGPGLITMVGDNDAGAFATYTQAGQDYGNSLLWVLVLLVPILVINQEMVARLGMVTGCGHAKLLYARFGKFWGSFSVGSLLVLNFLTIVTEFIGFSMGLSYVGISPLVSIPLAMVGLIAVAITGSFRRWESTMWGCCLLTFLTIPIIFFTPWQPLPIIYGSLIPSVAGGINSTSLFVMIALVGTTVAPWQFFFQQSNVVDKRLTPRWMAWERLDTYIGGYFTNTMAAALVIAAAFVLYPTSHRFVDPLTTAHEYTLAGYPWIGRLFAILLVNASIIGACTVSLSSAYAFGDAFGMITSLHSKISEAKLFYGLYSVLIIGAGLVTLIPGLPLGLFTVAVQALAGLLLPSTTVFLFLLCNDRDILGPWKNTRWHNIAAIYVVGVLIASSVALSVLTLFPGLDVSLFLAILACVFALFTGIATSLQVVRPRPPTNKDQKSSWHMPALETIPPPESSRVKTLSFSLLGIYILVSVILLLVKTILLLT